MRSRSIVFLFLMVFVSLRVPAQVVNSSTQSTADVTRRLMVNERTVQVVKSTYKPGAVEPPGTHPFDVVIVPLSDGDMDVVVAGKKIAWKSGEAFFIGRGVEHQLANRGRTPVDLISIRIP